MTYGYCRDAALKLIDRYSINGVQIESGYNNQAELLQRIPELISDALVLLCRRAPLESSYTPESFTRLSDGWVSFALPDDFLALSDMPPDPNGRQESCLLGGGRIALRTDGDVSIYYRRYPSAVTDTETESLDCRADAARAVPYYVAANLVMGEDEYRAAMLLNEFQRRLEELSLPPVFESGITENVYEI